MSPSQAFGTIAELVTTLVCVAILVVNWRNYRRRRAISKQVTEILNAVTAARRACADVHDQTRRRVDLLAGEVAELQSVRAELRRHATSNLLHPERADVA